MSFVKTSFQVLSSRIFVIFMMIVVGVIITRHLGPTGKGILVLISSIPSLFVAFGHLGIGNANLYFLGQKKYTIEEVLPNSISIALGLGSFLLLLSFLFYYLFKESLFKDIPFIYILICFSVTPLLLFQKFAQYIFLGKDLISLRNKLYVFPSIAKGVLALLLVVYLGYGVIGVLVTDLFSYLLTLLFTCYLIRKITTFRLGFSLSLFFESVRFGIVPFAALLVMNLIFKTDLYLIKYFMDNKAVGFYSLGVSIAEMLWLAPEAISLVLFANMSNVDKKRDKFFTPRVCRFSLNLAVLGSTVLFFLISWLLPLVYGAEFVPSVAPVKILLPGVSAITLYLILHSDLTAKGKASITLKTFLIALFLNIALNLWLIPIYGVNGAAIASSISYLLGSLFLALFYSRETQVPLNSLFFINKNDFREYIFPCVKQLFPSKKI